MRTTWTGVPKELRDAATPLLTKYAHFLPEWVRTLEVTFDDEMVDNFAEVESEPNYKRAKLIFGGGWLNCDEAKRDWLIRHELSHTQYARIEAEFEALILLLPKKVREMAAERFNSALEESVSGLAYALVKETGND